MAADSKRPVSPPQSIEDGARRHYEDGEHYAQRYAARTEDLDYFLRVSRRRLNILEFGCGTGRLTLPLAKAGRSVVAVDSSPGMLSVLRDRLALEVPDVRKRVEVYEADMRTFRSQRKFDLVALAFHTFGHLYSHQDVSTFLRLAFSQLVPGGIIVFDLPMPHVDAEDYDPVAQVRVTTMQGTRGPEVLTQRLFHPQEMLMHLEYAGFVRNQVTADFGSSPVAADTEILCVTGRKPTSC